MQHPSKRDGRRRVAGPGHPTARAIHSATRPLRRRGSSDVCSRTRSIMRIGGVAAVSAVMGCLGTGPTPVTTSPQWSNWVMFDQPESTSVVGKGFALRGQVNSKCYSTGQVARSPSLDSMRITWDRKTSGGLNLEVARVLGMTTAMAQAQSGVLTFNDVFIERAEDVLPIVPCSNAGRDGLPKMPVVVAALGARSFRLELKDSRGASLNAQAARELASKFGASVTASDTLNRSSRISFSTPRYIAGQFMAYQADTASQRLLSARVHIGVPTAVGALAEVQALRDTAADSYRLITRRLGPSVTWTDTVTVRDGSTFPFLRKAGDGVSGSYMDATFFVGPDGSEYMIQVDRHQLRELSWNTATQRSDLLRWVVDR